MVLRRVDQFHPSIAYGDAVSNNCFELQRLLWSHELRSELFAKEAKPEVKAFVRPYEELRVRPYEELRVRPGAGLRSDRSRDALLLVHLSMGDDSLDEVAELSIRKAVVYHNITPAHYFVGLNESHRQFAEKGREQLARFAAVAELGIGDSEFNRRELEAAGFAKTAVVPILVNWDAYDVVPDPTVLRALSDERTSILAVGQIVPQKAVHDVVAAFARYRAADPTARLFLVGTTANAGSYLDRLRAEINELGLDGAVTLTGGVLFEQLVAYYRGASAFVTLSDHEGFCVPLLEAMRFDLPVVAHAAAAIPDTLGDAGILLEDKRPETVAAALERAVRDRELRADLVARGRRRLQEFSRERVAARLREAFAAGGIALQAPPKRRIVVLSSGADDGIRPYARAVADGLRANGHEVSYLGVAPQDAADLRRKVALVPRAADAVIVEHEFGLFRDVSFVEALLRLRLKGVPVVLSLHELEPEKFHHYRLLVRALHYRQSYRGLLEVLRVPWVGAVIAWRFLRYRAVANLMGALPRRLVIHSDRARFWVDLLTAEREKVDEFPLVVRPLEGTTVPKTAEERRALRAKLGIGADAFVFVSPGYFFRRKRYLELANATPPDALLVLAGTPSRWEPEYYEEVREHVAKRDLKNVVIDSDWDRMNDHVAAADCAVLYYESVFQSGVATQAIWAGLPLILTDLPGFRLYEGAALFARDGDELRAAMREVRRPEVLEGLRRQARVLRAMLAPERLAPRYLADLGLPTRS